MFYFAMDLQSYAIKFRGSQCGAAGMLAMANDASLEVSRCHLRKLE